VCPKNVLGEFFFFFVNNEETDGGTSGDEFRWDGASDRGIDEFVAIRVIRVVQWLNVPVPHT
jgi:hypothetical protein